ncbi:MAG: ankyrin repeat domain-containing protein [Pseudomonadota bacterium]
MRHPAIVIFFLSLSLTPFQARSESGCVPLKQRALQAIQRGETAQVTAWLDQAFTIGHRDSDYPCAVVSVVSLYGWLVKQGQQKEAGRYTEIMGRIGRAERQLLRQDAEFVKTVPRLALPAHVLQADTARPPLLQALVDRRFEESVRLASDKANVHARDAEGRTALHWAATVDSVEWVERLIKAGLAVDVRDRPGRTPLGEAAFHGHTDVARLLLKRGADPNATDSIGGSPLIFAALRNRGQALSVLLEHGAKPDQADRSGATALMMAAYKGHLDIVERLLKAGADRHRRDSRGAHALDYARGGGRQDVIERLLR